MHRILARLVKACPGPSWGTASPEREGDMYTFLWLIAALLVIGGIVTLVRGGILAGIVMIVLGLLVGPGGVSIFR